MLTFLSPLWLYAVAPVALLGLVALWQGRHHRMRISSTLLWRDLQGQASGAHRRALDPLWLLFFLAALLASLAAARPAWVPARSSETPPDVQAVVRKLPDMPTAELFIRVQGRAADALEITPAGAQSARLPLDPAALAQGTIVQIPAHDEITLTLLSNDRPVAVRRFRRMTQPPIALYERGPIPPPLRRVFDLQPTIAPDDSPHALRILLVSAAIPTATAQPRTTWPQRDALVVFAGNYVPADLGLTPATPDPLAFAPPAPLVAAPSPITAGLEFSATVTRLRHVAFTADWQPLVRAGDAPLLLIRRDGDRNLTFVYLASHLTPGETNWPLDPSFVILFTRLVETMRPPGPLGDIQEWGTEVVAPAVPAVLAAHAFGPWLAAVAIALILLATTALLRRARL